MCFPAASEQAPVLWYYECCYCRSPVYMKKMIFVIFSSLVEQQLCSEAFPLTASDTVDK